VHAILSVEHQHGIACAVQSLTEASKEEREGGGGLFVTSNKLWP
jgi:hypothetical protein